MPGNGGFYVFHFALDCLWLWKDVTYKQNASYCRVLFACLPFRNSNPFYSFKFGAEATYALMSWAVEGRWVSSKSQFIYLSVLIFDCLRCALPAQWIILVDVKSRPFDWFYRFWSMKLDIILAFITTSFIKMERGSPDFQSLEPIAPMSMATWTIPQTPTDGQPVPWRTLQPTTTNVYTITRNSALRNVRNTHDSISLSLAK